MKPAQRLFVLAPLLLLELPPLALAHGHGASLHSGVDMEVDDGAGGHRPMLMSDMESFPSHPSYFLHPEYAGVMYAHIGLAILAWAMVLPIAVMLSIGRSSLTFYAQCVFLFINAAGILTSLFYNYNTPDLYENNVHHKAGWAITLVATAWTLISLVKLRGGRRNHRAGSNDATSVTQQAMAEHQRLHQGHDVNDDRLSYDSGQGTERNTASLASSRSNSWRVEDEHMSKAFPPSDDEEDFDDSEKQGLLRDMRVDRFISRIVPHVHARRFAKLLAILHISLERTILPLAFFALITGIVTYSGIFRAKHVFNGLAHFVKGGIFLWYGLLTFGRWMGSFSDFGWAWNIKPGPEIVGQAKAKVPSAEFTESFVIFFYGASNVFLEHLGAWGKTWTPMDLEHVSITVMFFGGGLLGMLIESRRVRKLLNGALVGTSQSQQQNSVAWQTPSSQVHPLNPMPALVIMLLGIMMSSHTQHSPVSAAIHKQWGTLFVGFALARAVTYMTLWLKPPSSYLPSRPPSEIVSSFCLVSGGIIFMASNKDTVNAVEQYGLDGMFIFTVVMGITALIMAWTVAVVASKGWAVRNEHKKAMAKLQALTD